MLDGDTMKLAADYADDPRTSQDHGVWGEEEDFNYKEVLEFAENFALGLGGPLHTARAIAFGIVVGARLANLARGGFVVAESDNAF